MAELEPRAYSFRDFLRELREIWSDLVKWFLETLFGAAVGLMFLILCWLGAMLAWGAIGWLASWMDPKYPLAMEYWLSDVLWGSNEGIALWVFLLLFFGAWGGRAFSKVSS